MTDSEKLRRFEQHLTKALKTGELSEQKIHEQFDWIQKSTKAHLKLAIYLKPKKRRAVLAKATALDCYDKITDLYDDVDQATNAFYKNLYFCLQWLYESLNTFCARDILNTTKENLKAFDRELFEDAFELLAEKIKRNTGFIEEVKEVNAYLNLLLQEVWQ